MYSQSKTLRVHYRYKHEVVKGRILRLGNEQHVTQVICFAVVLILLLQVSTSVNFSFAESAGSTSGGQIQTRTQSSWTIMEYMDGDINDFMEGAAIHDFNEIEAAPSNPAVNVVVQFDRIPGQDSSNGNWTTTRRYLVTHDTDPANITSTMIEDLGELNMGDPTTLVDFVEWAIQNYPAENYMLVLLDHGSGWRTMASSFERSICIDDSSGGNSLSLQELGDALNLINTDTGVKLDILGFDACLMGMLEVDYQIMQYVDYRVGSEENEPGDGWDYEPFLTALANNPSMTPSELASQIIDAYYIRYGASGKQTMSAVDLNLISSVISAMDTFTQRLILDVNTALYRSEIRDCREDTKEYGDPEFVDLYDFTSRVNGNPNLPADTKTAANTLMTALNNYVIDEQHGTQSIGSHGVSIYYPGTQHYEIAYDNIDFAKETTWSEWLKADITVEEFYEPDNSFAQAREISVSTSLSSEVHAIEPAGDNDYMRFLASPGTYTFYTSSAIDTYGYLYDANHILLTLNDDSGEGLNFRIVYNISSSGYYFLRVRAYSAAVIGYYTLYFQYQPPPAPTATPIAVVRGADDRIYYGDVGVSPNLWTQLPSGLTSDTPAAAVISSELHIVVRSTDGLSIWHRYVNMTDGTFSGWTLLSGYTPSAPTLTSNGTHLCLVVRGLDDRIYYRFYALSSRTWSEWTALPSGYTCDSPAATILNNRLHIVVRSTDTLTMWHSSIDLSTGTFSGWTLLSGFTQSKPTLAACSNRSEIVLVVKGLDNAIYRNSWSDLGWAGWVSLPTGSTNEGAAATVVGQNLHILVLGMEGGIIWKSSVNLSSGAFSGWTLLNGLTPSKPTLTS